MNYIIIEKYEGKIVRKFALGQYCRDHFGINSEDIPELPIIGRVPEHMADLRSHSRLTSSQLSGITSIIQLYVSDQLKDRGFLKELKDERKKEADKALETDDF